MDLINGAVADAATERDIPVPLNAEIVRLVHAMEKGDEAPTADHLASLRVIPDQAG